MATVLPDMNYDDPTKSMVEDPSMDQNIGSTFDCGGSLLTLSIHVQQEDVIKAYLYWNGKVMRFMPEDIRTVFPLIFNMEYPGNTNYMDLDIVDAQIEQLKGTLKDSEFDRFLKESQ